MASISFYKLKEFAAKQPRLSTLFVDDRWRIFDADGTLRWLYFDLVYEAEKFHFITGEQFIAIRDNILGFYDYILKNSRTENFPDFFRLYVDSIKTQFNNMLKNIYKDLNITKLVSNEEVISRMNKGREIGQTPQSFFVLMNYRKYFVNIQQSILDITILFQIYNLSNKFQNFVVVVGNNHLLQLSKYFEGNGVPLLRYMNSDINTNTVNLNGTFNYSTIEACARAIRLMYS